jgi:UDP-2,3-diacylglucosamine pyrophosphatase LpxH
MQNALNLLVISDLHLGADLNARASRAATPQLAMLERQLIEFLRHYTYTRKDGRPWRLVVDGDLVDFLGIRLPPGDGDEATPEEHVYGLGRRPRAARAKMRAVVERHPDVFTAMARFVAAGNRVEIIAGNHDVEFQWEAVQTAFVDGVRQAWDDFQRARGRDGGGERVAAGIGFHAWFYYEPGVAWIEHGHLYDENCSFSFALAPGGSSDTAGDEAELNVDAAAHRYVINHIPSAEPGQEHWTLGGYLRWAMGLGGRGALELARSYAAFAGSLIAAGRRPRNVEARRARHRERLRALSARVGLDETLLDAVHELRRRPVVNDLRRLLQVLRGGGAEEPSAPLGAVPERIRRHVAAPYVVFGHSHDAVRAPLENGGVYFNTGTWYPDEWPGVLRCFTHVVIEHRAGGPHAELRQWRDGASRAYTPGYAVAPVPPAPTAVRAA